MGSGRRAALLVAALTASAAPAAAEPDDAYAEAEAAVRGFRASTYLPTRCESTFRTFWKQFRAGDGHRPVHETTPSGARRYFGFGNPASETALSRASAICASQTGMADSLVLHVLRDRERAKERRLERLRRAERMVFGF